MTKHALITGANRGIGLEIAQQLGKKGFHVWLAGRNKNAVTDTAQTLAQQGIKASALVIDLSQPETFHTAITQLQAQIDQLDVLINNAAIFLDSKQRPSETPIADIEQTLQVNLVAPWILTQQCLPLLRKANQSRIVFVSTDLASMAQTSDPNSKYHHIEGSAYRATKVGLNMLALQWGKELKPDNISVQVCTPGWCRTELDHQVDMSKAPNSAAQGADTAVWLASESDFDTQTKFYGQRQVIDW